MLIWLWRAVNFNPDPWTMSPSLFGECCRCSLFRLLQPWAFNAHKYTLGLIDKIMWDCPYCFPLSFCHRSTDRQQVLCLCTFKNLNLFFFILQYWWIRRHLAVEGRKKTSRKVLWQNQAQEWPSTSSTSCTWDREMKRGESKEKTTNTTQTLWEIRQNLMILNNWTGMLTAYLYSCSRLSL